MSNRQLTERQREALRWCVALRSGRYKQCRGVTRVGDQVCAVSAYYAEINEKDDWYYLTKADAIFGTILVCQVIKMNDRDGLTFDQIADHIEQEVFVNVNV